MSGAVARGPLHSALAQWIVVGLGGFSALGNEDFTSSILRGLSFAFQLSRGSDRPVSNHQKPIVIHSTAASPSSGPSFGSTMLQISLGAGLCWGSYVLLSTCLPDVVKEMLPVTRKFFDQAVTSLGRGIVNVKEALGEQITGLSQQQDDLATKQDETHGEVLEIRRDIGDVKMDLGAIYETLHRCELSLSDAERRQSYTARGVRLLIRCVSAIMPANALLVSELNKFAQTSEEVQEQQNEGSSPEKPLTYSSSVAGLQQFIHDNSPQHAECPKGVALSDESSDGLSPESERYSLNQHIPAIDGRLDNYDAMVKMMEGIRTKNEYGFVESK